MYNRPNNTNTKIHAHSPMHRTTSARRQINNKTIRTIRRLVRLGHDNMRRLLRIHVALGTVGLVVDVVGHVHGDRGHGVAVRETGVAAGAEVELLGAGGVDGFAVDVVGGYVAFVGWEGAGWVLVEGGCWWCHFGGGVPSSECYGFRFYV